MNVDLSKIPPTWFLWSLQDYRTPVRFLGDKHLGLYWKCELQHSIGGRLLTAMGDNPQEAVDKAVKLVYREWPETIGR